MNVRTAKWAGIVITTATITGLIAYFAVVGLNEANELAGPISAVIGVIGIALTVYGMFASRSSSPSGAGGDNVNVIKGGTFYAPVNQAREVFYDSRPRGDKDHPEAGEPGTSQAR